jgi:glycosyltransferase involved in cell wall biosynthesis
LKAWREIRHYLREHGPFDVIHGHSSKAGALARLSGIARRRVKVYTPHAFVTMNSAMNPARRLLYRWIERFLDMLGDAVIATSPAEFEHARTFLQIPENKLFLVTNGIALPPAEGARQQRETLRRAWGIRDDEVVIGTVARLVPQKAPELLVRAFAGIMRRREKARLVMVGDGPLRERLEVEAARLGVSDAVIWPGYLEDPQVMSAFDVFALGSRYEGFPYVLLDALAAGLPVVTTAVGGAELAVDVGSNGIVVPIGGEKEMTEALSGLVADSDKRPRMGAASRIKVENFSVDRMVDETVEVYKTLLQNRLSR